MKNAMKLFLTSSPTGVYCSDEAPDFPGLDPANGMVERLKQGWREDAKCLIIAATPDAHTGNDRMRDFFEEKVRNTGLSLSVFDLCDDRNWQQTMDQISSYDFIILGGGHVPTQQRFFEMMGLREKLQDFDGIIMGISAGSMNCAEVIYAQPEEPGESVDPEYERFIPGLGLIDIQVLPHYNVVKYFQLDGRQLYEDITYEDSFGHKFYAICDGSYIYKEEDEILLCGEGYLITDGKLYQICDKGYEVEL